MIKLHWFIRSPGMGRHQDIAPNFIRWIKTVFEDE